MEKDDHSNSLRVASFSCYLDTAKESLVHRVSAQDNNISIKFSNKDKKIISQEHGGSLRVDSFSCVNTSSSSSSNPIQDPTSAFSFSHQIPKNGGGEIGVFGADRYFNMKLDYQTGSKNIINHHIQRPAQEATKNPATTPSLCSESTSWNSQTTLFRQNQQSHLKQKRAIATRVFMGFGCRSPCFDKKSVHIDAQRPGFYADSKLPSRTGSQRSLEPDAVVVVKNHLLEEPRPSIEVFGSRNRSLKGDVATNMERKLSMLTWDAIPKGRHPPTSAAGTSTTCDDMASDASSDLFEIENVSGAIYPILLSSEAAVPGAAAGGRHDDDVSSCMSPASLYAPSEASIQWSVVTASAADYSALSEFNDDSVSVAANKIAAQRGLKMRNQGGKEVQKITKPASGFLGCKNHKAVDVAQNVCIKTNKD